MSEPPAGAATDEPAVAPRAPSAPWVWPLVQGLGLCWGAFFAAALLACTVEAARAGAWTWVQCGVASLLLVAAPAAVLLRPRHARLRRVAVVLVLAGATRVAWALAPRPASNVSGGLVRTRFAREDAGAAAPWLWFQGLPERETVRLGAWVGMLVPERPEGLPALDASYAAVERAGLFEREGSPLLDSWCFDREHFWLAAPPGPGPFPLVVFVHGSGGTFQFYAELLARAAVERGAAIAFPSHGMGAWRGRDAVRRIERVVEAAAREVPIDRARVSLVGLSAGGPAVFAAAEAAPGRYEALVAVSAVFPRLDAGAASALRGTRVLVLNGDADLRTPAGHARRAHEDLVRAGVAAELDVEAGADHMALLTRRERWVPRILDWAVRRE